MFSLPDRSDLETGSDGLQVNEQYDGVPLVHFPDDSVDDFIDLLQVLYDPSALYLKLGTKTLNPDILVSVAGLMRIADKYLIDSIVVSIAKRVKMDWPVTLEQWDNTLACIRQPEKCDHSQAHLLHDPLAAIRFATKFDIPEILPAAFYHLATIDADGSLKQKDKYGLAPPRWKLLDPENQMRFIIGRERLYKVALTNVNKEFDKSGSSIQPFLVLYKGHSIKCTEKMEGQRWRVYEDFLKAGFSQRLDPLRLFQELRKSFTSPDLCGACLELLGGNLQRQREDIWRRLPEFFDLQVPKSSPT
ncbi:hypothetical protein PHLCEN_2v12873 [Hermanssonia centrifuga]|uniref:Uncharacterized protein n=1 Tax=Hermanssonia centrifuga TaxID=98765 RepID=A0A2R6NFZ2_9APHY|nr:hypothetical protein PHLCEN_2v12873 [Hermanssonia centrifuga]